MCDCGCGGSGSGCSGNCGGDCGQPSKIVTIEKNGTTDGVFYKGDDFTCASIPAIDYNDGDALGGILNKLSAQLCGLGRGGNYVFNSEDQIVVTNANSGSISKDTTGLGVVQQGDGMRLFIGGQFSSVTDAGGIILNLNFIAKDAAGNETNASIEQWTIPQSTIADRFKIETTLYLRSAADLFGYTFTVNTGDGLNELLISDQGGMPPYATFSDIGLELTATVNGTDQIIFHNIAFEHLRG